MLARNVYYRCKPFIPRPLQIALRRRMLQRKRQLYRHTWPIDAASAKSRDVPCRWPEDKRFALILTHDVETAYGQEKCQKLIRMEADLDVRSSFNFVPERYSVSTELRSYLIQHGFEVGVHGLNHDGKLYLDKATFQQRANRINHYLADWGAAGFRSPAMHHQLDWLHALNIEYDASTFDTDPFEAQPDGMGTIFPFWVTAPAPQRGYVELPYTLPQDFTLFILMQEPNIDIWKTKLDWIATHGGMALVNTHPDYMQFDGDDRGAEEYPARYYAAFIEYVQEQYAGQYWHVLPRDIARFWSTSVQRDET